MKKKLTKTAFNKLEAAIQALYKKVDGKKGGEESYVLDLEDDDDDGDDDADDDDGDDTNPAVRAKNREKKARQEAEQKLRDAQKELKDLKKAKAKEAEDAARDSGDVTALEASWRKKYEDREAELQAIVDARDGSIRKLMVDSQADTIAQEISTSPKAMSRLIKDRLTIETNADGEPEVRVLDSNGKPSALTLVELKKELASDKDLSGMIIGSKSSGGGAGKGGQAGGGAAFKIDDYKDAETGYVNWTKVADAEKATPGVLLQVKQAIGQAPAPAAE